MYSQNSTVLQFCCDTS